MPHMTPWNVDANDIEIGDLEKIDLDSFLVRTNEINGFLTSIDRNNKNFIVGPKGLGKTLLLKVKSAQLRESKSGYAFIPKKTLCERVSRPGVSFPIEDLNKFLTKDSWIKIWELCLYSLILRRFEIELPSEIITIIGQASQLSEIFACLLSDRKSIEKIYPIVNLYLKPKVRDLEDQNQGINQVAMFIDNIDEAFDDQISINEEIWVNAQISILTAVKNICSNNPHVKIYVSIRSEAYFRNQDPTRLQLDARTIFLKYSKDQIKAIFNRNIQLLPKDNFKLKTANDLLESLVGFNQIKHTYVFDVGENQIEENLFDYIYRHTFGRPREIVVMGEAITQLDIKSPEKIREVVNQTSYKLFEQLKREIIPFFNESEFLDFSKLVKRNFFTYEVALEASQAISAKYNIESICSKLYSLGILGYVDSNAGKLIQKFLPVGQATLLEEKIPEVEYFVLHPATYSILNNIYGSLRSFLDRYNIAGYEYPYRIKTDNRTINHMHMGLDRDSISIMIPELYKTKSLAVVIEPTHEFMQIEQASQFILTLNQRDDLIFYIYHDNLLYSQKKALINDWIHNQKHLLVYSRDAKSINDIFSNAHTISFCVPNTTIIKKLKHSYDSVKICYYCQKVINKKDFTRIKHYIKNLSPHYRLEKVFIDRFFYSSGTVIKEDVYKLNIQAEEYGKLICSDREGSIMKPSEIVIRTKNDKELKFFELRNYLLCEGIYQFYKMLKQYHGVTQYREKTYLFDLFIDIQINRIMSTTPINNVRSIYHVDSKSEFYEKLKTFSFTVLDRIDELSNNYSRTGTPVIVEAQKENKIFPADSEYYDFINKNYHRYTNSKVVRELVKVLNINSLSKFKTVFISYSFKDDKFAEKINDRLVLFGVKTFLFGQDNPARELDVIMAEEIDRHDKVLFISSKNSLLSRGCRFELSRCRTKYNNNWKKILVPIRIDDYIFEIEEYHIPKDENHYEIWANINHIKTSNVVDYSEFIGNKNPEGFDKMIFKLITESFTERISG